jgi:hypothetical protein
MYELGFGGPKPIPFIECVPGTGIGGVNDDGTGPPVEMLGIPGITPAADACAVICWSRLACKALKSEAGAFVALMALLLEIA